MTIWLPKNFLVQVTYNTFLKSFNCIGIAAFSKYPVSQMPVGRHFDTAGPMTVFDFWLVTIWIFGQMFMLNGVFYKAFSHLISSMISSGEECLTKTPLIPRKDIIISTWDMVELLLQVLCCSLIVQWVRFLINIFAQKKSWWFLTNTINYRIRLILSLSSLNYPHLQQERNAN